MFVFWRELVLWQDHKDFFDLHRCTGVQKLLGGHECKANFNVSNCPMFSTWPLFLNGLLKALLQMCIQCNLYCGTVWDLRLYVDDVTGGNSISVARLVHQTEHFVAQCPLHKFPEGDLATFCLAQGHLNFRDLVWCTCVISFVISGNHQVSIATRPAYQKWSSTQWNNESSQLQAEQSWTWRSMHIPQDTYATSVSVRLLEHVRTKYDKHLLFYWRRRIIVAPKRHCPRFEDCRSQCSLNKAEQNAEYADFNTTPFSTLKKPSKDL